MATPVVFIHGLWIHSGAWAQWIDLFTSRGYAPTAPGWPGDADTVEATRANPGALDGVGIEQICHHYADYFETLDAKPIVIGHSFGGLIAQELLANDLAIAAVAIDPAPIKGVKKLPFSQLRQAITEEESDALHEAWTIPGPGRPLFEDATANFTRNSPATVDTHTAVRGPLLLVSGTEDHTVPKAVTLEVLNMYADNDASTTEYHEFEGRGHSLTIDSGWRAVADVTLEWLASKRLGATTPATTA